MARRRGATAAWAFLVALLVALARWLAPGIGSGATQAPPRAPQRETPAREAASHPASGSAARAGLDAGALHALGDAALAAQIRRVVASMDATGRPPEGVAQGGRRGRRGVFQNAEGRLPARAPGHYTESDVWPRGPDGRGALRLVFGREGEVYFSDDHYNSFRRLR